MKLEISMEKFKALSPRRRWFLTGVVVMTVVIILDLLPGELPASIGGIAVLSLVLSFVLCVMLVISKIWEDVVEKN